MNNCLSCGTPNEVDELCDDCLKNLDLNPKVVGDPDEIDEAMAMSDEEYWGRIEDDRRLEEALALSEVA